MNDALEENDRDPSAFRAVIERIDREYPLGWFVAVAGDQILAASADFDELETMLLAQGKDPRHTLVFEAGAKRPKYVTIFI
jgi:hypothetical protein